MGHRTGVQYALLILTLNLHAYSVSNYARNGSIELSNPVVAFRSLLFDRRRTIAYK